MAGSLSSGFQPFRSVGPPFGRKAPKGLYIERSLFLVVLNMNINELWSSRAVVLLSSTGNPCTMRSFSKYGGWELLAQSGSQDTRRCYSEVLQLLKESHQSSITVVHYCSLVQKFHTVDRKYDPTRTTCSLVLSVIWQRLECFLWKL